MTNEKLPGFVVWMIGISAIILFGCSTARHILFQSSAYDLGIFDQAVYLISQGQPPISSFLGFHILGDHAAFIFYPLALLYKIYPSVYWLFAVQAIALALGALPTWYLANLAGLSVSQAVAIATAYLLYPLVFNVNLFDFHPEVIAVPAILGAVLAVKLKRIGWFCFCILVVLGCKAVLSLTVTALGIWLLVFEKKRLCGVIAIVSGIVWFTIATKIIIPFFGGEAASVQRHLIRYAYLGTSFLEVTKNILLKPGLVLGQLFSLSNLTYLLLLFVPVIWSLSPPGMKPLIGAVPTLGINLLSDHSTQKDLVHQYSLPVLPFLILAVISSLALGHGWLHSKRGIILWSVVAFFALAKYGYFWSIYLDSLDTWSATREAISQVQTTGSVYTTDSISAHLAHRQLIQFTKADVQPKDLTQFNYILLNIRQPGWLSHKEFATSLVNQLKNQSKFTLKYEQDEVYLFTRK